MKSQENGGPSYDEVPLRQHRVELDRAEPVQCSGKALEVVLSLVRVFCFSLGSGSPESLQDFHGNAPAVFQL